MRLNLELKWEEDHLTFKMRSPKTNFQGLRLS